MVRVIFVCLGNICRSPMAEAVFRDMLEKEGLEKQVVVDSAGTGNWHAGKPPHEGTRHILDQKGISYAGMKARMFEPADWHSFDYIITMDSSNMNDLDKVQPADDEGVTVAKLMDFVPDAEDKDVPDPYFTGNFEQTYALVQAGCFELIKHIKAKHKL
ncbi:Protein-tyrosine-phosphatase [Lentibacillus sp. JNUCC-1]|uniref:low molecular weight protein-tyrosine-phosphatase n=1 Tax=Lentibacillus sp. JNUCC-1 TaxID=2654513 RepID=UPI00132C1394|nr:Protein-tyrosine-phosphatase [Lentibacillus sp. JNUCC-1]